MNTEDTEERIITVPYTELSEDALRGIIEYFVLQEGTDYGEEEFSLDQKVAQVMRQLERKEAEIVFDTVEESCSVRERGRLAR